MSEHSPKSDLDLPHASAGHTNALFVLLTARAHDADEVAPRPKLDLDWSVAARPSVHEDLAPG